MVALALILLGLAVLLIVAVVSGDGQSLTVELFDADVDTSTTAVFFSGLVTGVTILLALVLLRLGLQMGWRQRKKVKDLERRAKKAETGSAGNPAASDEDSGAPGTSGNPRDDTR